LQKARSIAATPETNERARGLVRLGFAPLDALHLAFAEEAAVRWFVTTDDQLLRTAQKQHGQMRVAVVRPDQLPLDEENQT
jgi:predicted nucleic acid-binding protein